MKVAYCAGHGGNNSTPGKRSPAGEYEWDFNNKVAVAFANELKNYENVELLRTDDASGKTDVSLATRTNKANSWKADYYFSFHHNANTSKWGTWTGVETYTQTGVGGEAVAVAKAMHPALVAAYGLKDRKLKTSNFHITRETTMPAVLFEGGFMDSTIDIVKLRDDVVLKNAGIGMAKAFAAHVGLKRKTATDSGIKHTVVAGETLWGISRTYGTTVALIKEWNGLTSDTITVGQVLIIKQAVQGAKTIVAPVVKKAVVDGFEIEGYVQVVNVKNSCYVCDKPSSTTSRNLGTAAKGRKLPYIRTTNGWYEVVWNKRKGYINGKYGKKI